MEELLRSGYLCHPQQAYTLRSVTLTDGKARGSRVIEVCTAGGLQLDLLPDHGLDIGQARYKGTNVTFLSKNGYTAPWAAVPYENEFLHAFTGGMLHTCGLRSVGPAHRDGEEWHPLHGRYHALAAEQVSAYAEGDTLLIQGVIRETATAGCRLEVKRQIRIPIFGADVTVADAITNQTWQDEEFTLIYHCNFGWPFVSEKARVELPENRKTTPRTPFAATGLGRECTFVPPVPGEEERVFFHEAMERCAALLNPEVGIRLDMTWSDTLPILAHWRSMAAGDYVCGLEPTNCYIMGRKAEREHGTLPVLHPFETVHTHVTFRFTTL